MQMEKGLDTGDMLLKSVVPIAPKETGESLHDKLMEAGAKLVVEALSKIEKKEVTPQKQDEALASYAARLTKSMGEIDWNKEGEAIERLVRGLNSWPSAYTYFHGKTLKIWEADAIEEIAEGNGKLRPGCVAGVEKDFFDVYTGRGVLRIRVLQLEGKRRMTVREFLAGYEVMPGMLLGRKGDN